MLWNATMIVVSLLYSVRAALCYSFRVTNCIKRQLGYKGRNRSLVSSDWRTKDKILRCVYVVLAICNILYSYTPQLLLCIYLLACVCVRVCVCVRHQR